jgi:DeoR/GlpR family transcriptional regulator of sugar metabolism
VKENPRLEQIVTLVKDRSFLSIAELSSLCGVSEMTIRRDLEKLVAQKQIRRTYGGAISYHPGLENENGNGADGLGQKPVAFLVDQVDVLIATSVNPDYDGLLIDRARKKNIPIIAESIEMPNQLTLVAVDNYKAGRELGSVVGQQLPQLGIEKAHLLDLTFHQPNTRLRSRGFTDGLEATCQAEVLLSINTHSRSSMAYQMAYDALKVYPQINIIFAINDTTAKGAIQACRDLNIDPGRMQIVTFGLEGDTFKDEIMAATYCKTGLAMFPEIVSFTCVEAAIAAYNHRSLPEKYITPHVVLNARILPDYYSHSSKGWELNWDYVRSHLNIPIKPEREAPHPSSNMPGQIGFLIPFTEHEWYMNLTSKGKEYAEQYGIGIQVIDAEQNVRDEVEIRRRRIAIKAASIIEPGNVVLIDGGPIAAYLAGELKQKKDITVITNSVIVFDILNHTTGITIISTGGTLRDSSQTLVGPTAEGALKELRADKLFLMVSGISLGFGLSHNPISEITIKQAMIRSAREVILLADYTSFGEDAGLQVAPFSIVNKLITDDALPPSIRLSISKSGVQIMLV